MRGYSPTEYVLKLSELPPGRVHEFTLEPDQTARDAAAQTLDILGIRKLRFVGKLSPLGRRDWALSAELGATTVQECVVTLDPVVTRIDEPVSRTYLANPPETPEGGEVEMPEDETIEALPEALDLEALMIEALALALPAYPRSANASLEETTFAAPGTKPMEDDDVKPFAGLAQLKAKLSNEDNGE